MVRLRKITWPSPHVKDCDNWNHLCGKWLSMRHGHEAPFIFCLQACRRNSQFERPESQINVASLLIWQAIFHFILPMKWLWKSETNISPYLSIAILRDICRNETIFLLCFLPSPHPWSIKESDIQAPTRWLFWDINLPSSLRQPALWIKSYRLHLPDCLAYCVASRVSLDSLSNPCSKALAGVICTEVGSVPCWPIFISTWIQGSWVNFLLCFMQNPEVV